MTVLEVQTRGVHHLITKGRQNVRLKAFRQNTRDLKCKPLRSTSSSAEIEEHARIGWFAPSGRFRLGPNHSPVSAVFLNPQRSSRARVCAQAFCALQSQWAAWRVPSMRLDDVPCFCRIWCRWGPLREGLMGRVSLTNLCDIHSLSMDAGKPI